MRKLFTLSLLGLFALAAGSALAAGTGLGNPGFETVPAGGPGDWNTFAGGPGAVSQHSTDMPHSGTGHMDLQTGGANAFAGVFQFGAVTFPAGATVTFTGWHKSLIDPFNGTREVKIEWAGAPELRVDEIGMIPTEYTQFSLSGVAPAGVTAATITYAISTFNPNQDFNNVYIDDFEVTCTPEPASLALVGLAALGLIGIRRRSK